MPGEQEEYTMKITRGTVDKLGVKLYDKVSAVIAELVANAYDADAELVEIELPLNTELARKGKDGEIEDKGFDIIVKDYGHGMTPAEMDDFYLNVGADRRRVAGWGARSRSKERPVMGRKGIGKLAAFGVCRKIEVRSAGGEKQEDGYQVAHIIMDYDEILEESEEDYHPERGPDDRSWDKRSGTMIRLFDFLPKRVPDSKTFHRQLARRFGLRQKDFLITFADTSGKGRGGAVKVGELEIDLMENTGLDVSEELVMLDDGTKLEVTGWIAFAKEAYPNEEVAGVRIYARGKLVATTRDFGISGGFTGEYSVRCYVVGEVHANWLDEDEDLIQTHRQDILWSSEKGQAFSEWGKKIIKKIGKLSRVPHRKRRKANFMEISKFKQHVVGRFAEKEIQKAATDLGELIGGSLSDDELKDEEFVENVREVIITAAPHRVFVDSIREVAREGTFSMRQVIELFHKGRIAELCSYGLIARNRVQAVDRLERTIEDSSNERDLQLALEEAPWLANPQWHPVSANSPLRNFRQAFESWFRETHNEEIATSAIESEGRRPDFILLHVGSALEMIEIKARTHRLNNEEWRRLELYISSLERFMEENPEIARDFPAGVHATLVCDAESLGLTEKNSMSHYEESGTLHRRNWREFLASAKKAQDDFLEERRRIESSMREEESTKEEAVSEEVSTAEEASSSK